MPILPSGGARFIEPGGGSAPKITVLRLRQASPGVFTLAQGAPDLELADISATNTFVPVTPGTSPTATRLTAYANADGSVVHPY